MHPLLSSNRSWSDRIKQEYPDFLPRIASGQSPQYLWIGCADSRVPPSFICSVPPGEIFVHRNVGNLVRHDDPNAMSVVQFAVDVLQVKEILVCGHTNCGGVAAVNSHRQLTQPLSEWLRPLRKIAYTHRRVLNLIPDPVNRAELLARINVIRQVDELARSKILRLAWQRGQSVTIHSWLFDLNDGLLHDLDCSIDDASIREDRTNEALEELIASWK